MFNLLLKLFVFLNVWLMKINRMNGLLYWILLIIISKKLMKLYIMYIYLLLLVVYVSIYLYIGRFCLICNNVIK